MFFASVTSNAGLYTFMFGGAVGEPAKFVTSAGSRCSIGICEPSAISRSKVLEVLLLVLLCLNPY